MNFNMNFNMKFNSRPAYACLFLLLALSGLTAAFAQSKNTRSIEERAFPQTWQVSLPGISRPNMDFEERRQLAKRIEPAGGKANLTLKDGAITGDVIWTGRKGEKSAGKVTGWLRGDRFAMVFSYPTDFLKVEGKYKYEDFKAETATITGVPYSAFRMTPIEERGDGYRSKWSLRFNSSAGQPETAMRVTLRKDGEHLVGRTVRGKATHVRYANDISPENSNIVGLFEGTIKGDQFKGVCTESTGNTVLTGKWDPFANGFVGAYKMDGGRSGTFHLADGRFVPANVGRVEERNLHLALTPPIKGARINIMPRLNLKIWQSEVQATMSYRIGWCGNERPRRLSYKGTISNGNIKLTADEPPDQVLIKSLNIKLRTDGITCTGTALCSDGTVRSISPWIQLKNDAIKSGRQEKEGENGLTSMFLSLHKTEMHSHNHRALNSNTAKIRTK